MKIGIVTYHRSHNYGALLQAIATRIVLESLGHEAYYVDYWPGYHRRMYALVNEKALFQWNLLRSGRYLLKLLYTLKNKRLRRTNMNCFIAQYIEPYCKPETERFDAIVYGSDQIWRKQREGVGYNPIYFGQNDFCSNRHVSYAASMGILPKNATDTVQLRELLSHLDRISVREENLKDYLVSIGIPDVHVSLDPTLLLMSEQWDGVFNSVNGKQIGVTREKYILFYDLMPNSFRHSEIVRYAYEKHCKLKVLYGRSIHRETADRICTASPKGFVDLIRNAEFVFTSSFHGLVFSIIYEKPFLASFALNAGRAESILQQLGLSDRLAKPMGELSIDNYTIDYKAVKERLKAMRTESIQFIADSI